MRIAQLLTSGCGPHRRACLPFLTRFEAIRQISSLGLNAEIFSFARAVIGDIDKP